ncbi:phage protease [Sphingomonas sp.]|uniref:phage protease n=1 Tax=Sphingomonas sp. TaxID=28214 RepID=UPI00307E5393
MNRPLPTLCSAVAIAFDGDGVPDWVQLLPAGEARSVDGRGPYTVKDAQALCAASLKPGEKLVLDVNHATDLKGPKGEEAPARGWIVALESRETGVWGKVEWTGEGRQMMADRQYRGISPVIFHTKAGEVTRIARASLTNTPNLIGMASLHAEELHQEEDRMNWKEKLLELLKLDSSASDDDIVAALTGKLGDQDHAEMPALQSALAQIGKIAGVAEGADAAAVLAGVEALAANEPGEVKALQTQVATLTSQIDGMRDEGKRKDATAFVDAAIREGRVGVKPQRDEYIAMHMENPKRVEGLIGALPKLGGGGLTEVRDVEGGDRHDDPALLAADAAAYQKKLQDAGQTIDFASAVVAVKEGKDK